MTTCARITRAFMGVAVLALMVASSPAQEKCDSAKNIVQTAIAAGQFKTLVKAVEAAGLAETLSGTGPFTVFAPTDEAFAKLPEGALESLLKNPEALKSVLLYHVVPGKVMAADVVKLKTAKTALGQSVQIDASKDVRVENANVVKTDITASNGVIHVIDTVLMPKNDIIEAARAAGSFKTLLTAIEAAGLTDTLRGDGPFTVFAPTDEAFAKLPKETLAALLKDQAKLASILTYHVVPGKVMAADVVKLKEAKTVQGQSVKIDASNGVKVDDAKVVKTDVPATNGIIHVIDSVLLPPDVKLGAANGDVGRTITRAIEHGVPLFNSGNVEACAAVYEVTAATVLDLAGEQLEAGSRARLERGLREARHAHGASDRAWALRHAFDDLLAEERGMMRLTASQ
jgi:transforming growth factor-beta-induced protein